MGPDARVAVYYAPLPDDPLFAAGATWLGRDPESGAPVPQPDMPGIEEVTAEPRLYGFHATLKPPMRLAEGRQWFDVVEAATELADRIAPFELPRLAVHDLFGFLALRETVPCAALQALADACVEHLDPLSRAAIRCRTCPPPTRQSHAAAGCDAAALGLSVCVRHLVLPHDADTPADRARRSNAISRRRRRMSRARSPMPRRVTDICLFVQPAPGAPFVIEQRLKLRG